MHFKTSLKPSYSLVDLTPLVDVTFLMLIFFIVTSDILPLKSLHIDPPSLERSSPALTTQLILVMDAQHVIYLGSRKDIIDFHTLKERLTEEIQQLKEQRGVENPMLVLNVDKRVDYGEFLRLFSIAQECSPHIRLVHTTDAIASLKSHAS